MSQEALAEKVGVSGLLIHLYETGVADPVENLLAIAGATGRPPSWFLEDEGVPATVPAASEPMPELAPSPRQDPEPEPEPKAEPRPPSPSGHEADELGLRLAGLAEREATLAAGEERQQALAAELTEREAALAADEQRHQALAAELAEREATIRLGPPPPETAVAQPVRAAESPTVPPAGTRPTKVVRVQQLGGSVVIVDTDDGQRLRVTAAKDEHSRRFVPAYEIMVSRTWQGRVLNVWEETRSYRPCAEPTPEACLESALAEIETGPKPAEPEPEPEPVEVEKPRRSLARFLHRREAPK